MFAGAEHHARCTALIVTYNSAADIGGALASLRAAGADVALRVVVVDNASTDRTVEIVRTDHPDVVLVESGGNLGFAGGLNAGAPFLGPTDAVLALNADVRLAPHTLDALLAALDDCAVAAVVPRLIGPDGAVQPSLRREPSVLRTVGDALFGAHWPQRPAWLGEVIYPPAAYASVTDVDWATGAVLLVRYHAWTGTGPWDERFFLYGEETDFAHRLRSYGARIRYVPSASAVHQGAGSGSSYALDTLLAVNRVRYARKHHGLVSAAGVWTALLMGSLLRARRASDRATLRVLPRHSRWAALPRAGSS